MSEFYELVKRVRGFVYNLSYAISFLVFGGFTGGYWLVVAGLATKSWVWTLGGLLSFPIFSAIAYLVATLTPRAGGIGEPPRRRLRWVLSFAPPFAVYAVLGMFVESLAGLDSAVYYALGWIPALGASLLLVHLLVERVYIKLNPELHKAIVFLPVGILLLLESPIVFLYHYYSGPEKAWMLGLGLVLLDYVSIGLYALSRATRILRGDPIA